MALRAAPTQLKYKGRGRLWAPVTLQKEITHKLADRIENRLWPFAFAKAAGPHGTCSTEASAEAFYPQTTQCLGMAPKDSLGNLLMNEIRRVLGRCRQSCADSCKWSSSLVQVGLFIWPVHGDESGMWLQMRKTTVHKPVCAPIPRSHTLLQQHNLGTRSSEAEDQSKNVSLIQRSHDMEQHAVHGEVRRSKNARGGVVCAWHARHHLMRERSNFRFPLRFCGPLRQLCGQEIFRGREFLDIPMWDLSV